MTTVSSTYRPHPEHFHWELRAFLCYFLVREPVYKQVLARLEPYWSRVRRDFPHLDPSIPYRQLPASPDPHDALNTYLAHLRSEVSNTLRCREQGAPADWVCHAVHAGLTDTPLDYGNYAEHHLWIGALLLPVSTFGTAMVASKINTQMISTPADMDRLTITEPIAGSTFSRWKQLRKAAHEELDRLLETLRSQVETTVEEWPRIYSKGRITRTRSTMEKLVRWVVGGEEQFLGDRSATYELLRELRLDPPGKSEKSNEMPPKKSE